MTVIQLPRTECPERDDRTPRSGEHRPSARRRAACIDPGPPIPWVLAPVIALGMAAAMLPWLPAAFLMHISRPE